jgi:hypothetical protein
VSNFEIFKDRLKKSTPAVGEIAALFTRLGKYDVYVPAVHVPKDRADCKSDLYDLKVRKPGREWTHVEVKGPDWSFKALSGFKLLTILAKDAWDRKEREPDYVFIVPNDVGHSRRVFSLDVAKHRGSFLIHKIKDEEKNQLYDAYHLPPDHFKEVKLARRMR